MSSSETPPSPSRRYLLMAGKIAVSVMLMVILFRQVDVERLWMSARNASLGWLLAALGVYVINVLASTWRWQLLLTAQGIPVRSQSLLGSLLVALFFNNFLPSNIGGDVVRSEEHTSELQSRFDLVCRLLLEKKK